MPLLEHRNDVIVVDDASQFAVDPFRQVEREIRGNQWLFEGQKHVLSYIGDQKSGHEKEKRRKEEQLAFQGLAIFRLHYVAVVGVAPLLLIDLVRHRILREKFVNIQMTFLEKAGVHFRGEDLVLAVY